MPQDSTDARRPKSTRGFPVGLVVAFADGLFVGGGGVALGGYFWLTSRQWRMNEFAKMQLAREQALAAEQRANLKGNEKKTYLREEFEMMVKGKTEAEVRALLGEPDMAMDGDNFNRWIYQARTHKSVTGYIDPLVNLYFRNGVCDKVDW